ncbi:MAG: hypothetical protein WC461_01410 [Candidatus Paceibacterota bacterium]
MEKFIKENWFKLGLLIILAISIIGVFYWYGWRPTQTKQRCFAEAEFDKRATFEPDDIKRQEFINMYYGNCLMRFGLK